MKRLKLYAKNTYDTTLDIWFLCGEFVTQLKTKLAVARLRRIGKGLRDSDTTEFGPVSRDVVYIDVTMKNEVEEEFDEYENVVDKSNLVSVVNGEKVEFLPTEKVDNIPPQAVLPFKAPEEIVT